MNLQPNTTFAGRYRLIKQIGRGGFSVVWLVADQMTEDTEMALKIYAPDKGMDEGGLKMFRREYTVTAKLNHNGLLKASHFDIHDGSPYLVMPFCEKGSLQALLMEKGTLPEKEIARILAQTAAALEYLHSEDIVHQDIKPDNVLIDNKGNYFLTDFGISSRLRSTLRKSTNTGKAMTVAYAPPERFGAKQQSVSAGDIFSLGVVLYELTAGDVPWMGAGGAILRADSELPELPEGYSKELEQLMQQCLSFDPSQRPTAAQLKSTTEQYLKSGKWPAVQNSGGVEGGRKTEHQPEIATARQPVQKKTASDDSDKFGNDFRDGWLYKTVRIGNQVWMTENLKVETFRNGDSILQVKTAEEWRKAGKDKQPAWGYYENDIENGKKYGKLYNWYAVNDSRGLAPSGWHIPSDAEWTQLLDYLGVKESVGVKLKSMNGWEANGNGNNESGFDAVPAGYRGDSGNFYALGRYGYWWNSTEINALSAWSCSLFCLRESVARSNFKKQFGFSVRCIKDE